MPTKDYFSKSNFSYFWTKLSAILNDKVDKETGKGLSTNDFTTAYKNKLDWVNVAYGSCSTAASTATKTVTVNSNTNWTLQTGSFIAVTFTTSNTANSPKLDVNGTGAKGIKFNGTSVTSNNKDKGGISGKTIFYIYDGVNYVYIAQDGERNIDTIPSAYCNTDGATATKTAVLTDYVAKSDSYTFITIVDANTSQGALTLNINNTGAKPIFINGTVSSATNYNLPAGTYIIYYDGTNYYFRTDDKVPMNIAGDAATVNGKTVGVNVPSNAVFTDTTYTFATGDSSGQIKITPSNGSAQNITVKNINNAAYKDVDSTIANASTSTKLPTSQAVASFVEGKGYVTHDTTYSVVSKTADGLAPQLPNETTTTKFLRQDGTWNVPPGQSYNVVSKTADGLAPQLPNETTITKFLRQDGTWAVPPGTEYDCKPAAQGGTDLSLVTTGEKYIWNNNSAITSSAYCDTLGTTAEKVAVCEGYTLRVGANMQIVFAYSNTSANALTLDISNTGAKPIYLNGQISSATNYNLPAGVYLIKYSVHPTRFPNGAYLINTTGIDPISVAWADDASHIDGFTVGTDVPSDAVFTDTKNTAGSSERLPSEKLYVIGSTTQLGTVITHSDSGVYIGTDGHLYSNGKQTVNLSDTQSLTNKTINGLTLTSQTTGFTISGGTTSKTLTVNKDITLGNAAAKDVDTTIAAASTSTKLPTSQAVASFVEGKGYATTSVVSTTADGLAPQLPSSGSTTKYLRADGTWVVPPDTTYNNATTSVAGLMSANDKSKLDYINITRGSCSQTGDVVNKVVTLSSAMSDVWKLEDGAIVCVYFSYTNTSEQTTLNVNSTGAYKIWYQNHNVEGDYLRCGGVAKNFTYYIFFANSWYWLGESQLPFDTYTSAVCTTAAGTAAKTADCSYYTLTTNTLLHLVVRYANTSAGALTLAVNGQTAKPIYINGTISSSTNYTLPAGSYLVYYDGTNYYFRTDGKITSEGLLSPTSTRSEVMAGDGNWYYPIIYAQDPNVIQDASHKIGTITINEDISNTIDIYQKNVILSGTSEPDPSLGSNGDVYILLDS